MALPLKEQVVIVTGAGRGLGAAIATAFAREGASVAINYRESREKAEALAKALGPGTAAFKADVRDPREVAAMVRAVTEQFGAPTTVIHNALADFAFNGDARTKLSDLTWQDISAQAETGVGGALNLIRAIRPAMAEAGFGRFVLIGTNLFQNPVVPYHDYTAAKAALLSLTRTAAAELGPLGVTVNMVSGGLLRVTDASAATPDAVFDLIAASTPLRQVTTPEELADAVLFFASPWARAVTGQNLIVDGGLVFG
ncbi:3-oxoacyl-ACP reductase [Ciceribacter sp. L1K23]|uniref:3-oxoacyl-ACP reductase n=1 Tax=Ciceribacter sp. L1K23 TaxID=2820276 RepID=UPI001B8191B2|nr:3-oxoacyl-ACP reductase [Ciceribacter sp. L1K23]MBR0557286.1 3-oxoacyl-ACP reductase [Ciceribacter sp. L1K23]